MLVKGGAPLPRSERHHRRCPTDGTHHRGMCGAQLPRRERHQRVWVGRNAVLTCSRVPFKGTRWEPGRNQEGNQQYHGDSVDGSQGEHQEGTTDATGPPVEGIKGEPGGKQEYQRTSVGESQGWHHEGTTDVTEPPLDGTTGNPAGPRKTRERQLNGLR